MGSYKAVCIIGIVQIGIAIGYIYHQSTLSRLSYQYQKAKHEYETLLQLREQKRQRIQTDHDYSRILAHARKHGMRQLNIRNVIPIGQDTS